MVVDEGPGMSGSSFLSVGEALVAAGVDRSHIQFLCSRQVDATTLCARDAAARWNGFRSLVVSPNGHLPTEARIYLGGGYWRRELARNNSLSLTSWPASWTQMERLKFLSPDRRTLFKFAGYSRFGDEIRDRARLLSEAGYAPAPSLAGDGFLCREFVPGDILTPADRDRGILARMAQYCAWRQSAFPATVSPNLDEMQTMLHFNVSEEFGVRLNGNRGSLACDRPVLVDGRMLPHEWVRRRDGRLVKCDGDSHGDDHFFPGPATDICWDLAGAILEWEMPHAEAEYFLRQYQLARGEDPRRRLPIFLLAYAVFRMAYCKMAAVAMSGTDEEPRLLSAYRRYRRHAAALLPQELPAAG